MILPYRFNVPIVVGQNISCSLKQWSSQHQHGRNMTSVILVRRNQGNTGTFPVPKSSKSDVTASQWAPKLGYQAVGNEEILPRQYRIEMSMEGQRARSQTTPSLLVSGLKMAATTMKQIRHLTRCDPVSWEHFVVITQIIQRTEEPNTDYISLCHDLSRIFVTICLFLT